MKKKFLILAICVTVVLSSATVILATGAGSEDDPLISMSYIQNQLIPRIAAYIDQRLGDINPDFATSAPGHNRHFEVVSVSAGQRIIGESGTEFILRAGSATIIASQLGGISNTTDGADLQQGAAVPMNHLLIVPRSDGRGLNVTTDALVMVRGRYSIQ